MSISIILAYGCTKDTPSASQKDDFIKCFGGPYQNKAIDMIADNGYIYVLGNTQKANEAYQIQLIKIDEFGNTLWDKSYIADNKQTVASQIIKLKQQNGFAILGSVESDKENLLFDPYFLIIDNNGDTLTTKIYTNPLNYDYGKCMAELENGGFAICILSTTNNMASSSIYIQTLDENGGFIKKSSPIPGDEIFQIWKKIDNKGFYVSALNNSNPVTILVDAEGNSAGSQKFVTINGKINSMTQVSNGSTYVCGQLTNGSNGKTDGFIAKLKNVEESFEYDWLKEYGTTGNDELTQIVISSDNQLLMIGTKEITTLNTTDSWILKTDLSGNILNEKTIGGDNNDYGTRILEFENNKYWVENTINFEKQSMISVAVAKFE